MAVKTYTNNRTGRQVTVDASYLPKSLKKHLVNPVEPQKPSAIVAKEKVGKGGSKEKQTISSENIEA